MKPREPTSTAAAEGPSAFDEDWRCLTMAANDAYTAGKWTQARHLYDAAIREAERRFTEARQGISHADAAPMLVVSFANLAELLADKGDARGAVTAVHHAAETLRRAVADQSSATLFRRTCFDHLKRGLALVADHAARAGPAAPETGSLIEAAQATAHAYLSETQPKH